MTNRINNENILEKVSGGSSVFSKTLQEFSFYLDHGQFDEARALYNMRAIMLDDMEKPMFYEIFKERTGEDL